MQRDIEAIVNIIFDEALKGTETLESLKMSIDNNEINIKVSGIAKEDDISRGTYGLVINIKNTIKKI